MSKVEDAQESWAIAADFYGLSLGEPILVSAEHGRNVGDLLDRVVEHFPEGADTEEDDSLKIALVGRPNVGKSSLVNRILGNSA